MCMHERVQLRGDHKNEHAPVGDILPKCDYIWKQELKKERESLPFLDTLWVFSAKPSGVTHMGSRFPVSVWCWDFSYKMCRVLCIFKSCSQIYSHTNRENLTGSCFYVETLVGFWNPLGNKGNLGYFVFSLSFGAEFSTATYFFNARHSVKIFVHRCTVWCCGVHMFL